MAGCLGIPAGEPQHAAQQGGVVQTTVAVRAGRRHELRDERADRDHDAGLAGRGGDDAEVLVVQVDAEPGLEGAGEHALTLLVEDLAPGEPTAEDVQGGGHVDPVGLEERDGFGEELDVAAHDELVRGLDGLARTAGAHVHDGLADGLQHLLRGLEVRRVPADHDRQ